MCCESDSKLEKLKFAEAVKIGVRFEKSEHDFWSRMAFSIRKKLEHDLAKSEHDFAQKHKNKTYFYGLDFVPIYEDAFTINIDHVSE